MNTACVVKAHDGGLGSLINKIITSLFLYEYVHVDWSDGQCFYGDCWAQLFETNAHPKDLGLEFDVIQDCPNYTITGTGAGLLYEGKTMVDWRNKCHEQWKRLTVRPYIYGLAQEFVSGIPGTFTAVQIRSEGHCIEQLSGKPQNEWQYVDAIHSVFDKRGKDNLYVMASDDVALHWFDNVFPSVHYYPLTKRSDSRSVDYHTSFKQTEQDAIDALVEMLIVSQAHTFIHPTSNMATCCLFMNPEMQSIYLQ